MTGGGGRWRAVADGGGRGRTVEDGGGRWKTVLVLVVEDDGGGVREADSKDCVMGESVRAGCCVRERERGMRVSGMAGSFWFFSFQFSVSGYP